MSLATNIPVEEIEALASRIQSQASQLESQLSTLRAQCSREANFTGSAATKYDEFLSRWDGSQQNLLQAIRGAGQILSSLAANVRSTNDAAASSFD